MRCGFLYLLKWFIAQLRLNLFWNGGKSKILAVPRSTSAEAIEYIAAFPTWFWCCLEWWQTYKPAATRPPPLNSLHSRQSRFLLLMILFTVCTFDMSLGRFYTKYTPRMFTQKRDNFFKVMPPTWSYLARESLLWFWASTVTRRDRDTLERLGEKFSARHRIYHLDYIYI